MSARRSPKPFSEQKRTDPRAARLAALAHLARRDFAIEELRGRLCSQGFEREAVGAAIAELTHERILDDARYAQNFVMYRARRGQGPQRIAAELRKHALAEALLEAALASGPDWGALAQEVRRGRFGAQPPKSWPEKARQARFLQYRGFSADDIRAATGAHFDRD